jgi:hypothetical protein
VITIWQEDNDRRQKLGEIDWPVVGLDVACAVTGGAGVTGLDFGMELFGVIVSSRIVG